MISFAFSGHATGPAGSGSPAAAANGLAAPNTVVLNPDSSGRRTG